MECLQTASLFLLCVFRELQVYGKRQIQVEKYKMSKIKELKTINMDKKLRETTYLCVEIMNRKRQVHCKRETWSRGTNLRLPFDVT